MVLAKSVTSQIVFQLVQIAAKAKISTATRFNSLKFEELFLNNPAAVALKF